LSSWRIRIVKLRALKRFPLEEIARMPVGAGYLLQVHG